MTRFYSGIVKGSKIGSGHFGQVFHAIDPVHGNVAVKYMEQASDESDAAWARRKADLVSEGRRLSQATHNHVVTVHHAVESEGGDSFMIVMELCDASLQGDFDRGPMPLDQVRHVANHVLSGLESLHAKGMIHRDIKPANIMLKNGSAKLGDFGLVTDEIILGYAEALGYTDHLPPEIHDGGGTSVKSDVWAVGMTLYRLIHGRQWYEQMPKPRFLISAGGFASKLQWLPHVPDPWRRVIKKMLHDEPSQRCQSARAVQNLLSSVPSGDGWACEVAPGSIKWNRRVNDRRQEVEWTHTGTKYEWRASSLPTGAGRTRTLGRSSGKISREQSRRELRELFDRLG